MRPDSYRTRSPESWDLYGEEGSNMAVSKVNVSDKALSMAALVVAALTLGMLLMYVIREPAMVDAKINAGIAKAEETSRLASTNARLSLEKLDQATTRLAVIEDRMQRRP